MKITKDGKPIVCDDCECEFKIESGDKIIIKPWKEVGLWVSMGYDRFVKCPSCTREIKIDSNYGYLPEGTKCVN